MEQIVKIIPKHKLYIVDENDHFSRIVKDSLEKKFGEEVSTTIFPNAEIAVEAMKKSSDKPNVVLMNHPQNKEIPKENGDYAIEAIQKISPETAIIIVAAEENKEQAARALGHGANGFVVKDQFVLDHIGVAVERCLFPVKM